MTTDSSVEVDVDASDSGDAIVLSRYNGGKVCTNTSLVYSVAFHTKLCTENVFMGGSSIQLCSGNGTSMKWKYIHYPYSRNCSGHMRVIKNGIVQYASRGHQYCYTDSKGGSVQLSCLSSQNMPSSGWEVHSRYCAIWRWSLLAQSYHNICSYFAYYPML